MYKVICLPSGHAAHEFRTYVEALNYAASCDDDIIHVLDHEDFIVESFEKEFVFSWE